MLVREGSSNFCVNNRHGHQGRRRWNGRPSPAWTPRGRRAGTTLALVAPREGGGNDKEEEEGEGKEGEGWLSPIGKMVFYYGL